VSKQIKFTDPAGSTTDYISLINQSGQWYNTVTPAFEAFNASNWTSYAIAATQFGTSKVYSVDMPSVAAGVYDIVVRIQAGGSAAITDLIIGGGQIEWDGSSVVYQGTAPETIRNIIPRFDTNKIVKIASTGVVTTYTPATTAPADVGAAMVTAVTAASSGDTIYVNQSAVINQSIAKDGVNWVFGDVSITHSVSGGIIFQVTSSPMTFDVLGRGNFTSNGVGSSVIWSDIAYNGRFQCASMTGDYTPVNCDLGNIYIKCDRINGRVVLLGPDCIIDCPLIVGAITAVPTSGTGTMIIRGAVVDSRALLTYDSITVEPSAGVGTWSRVILDGVVLRPATGKKAITTDFPINTLITIIGGIYYEGTIDSHITLVYGDRVDVRWWLGSTPNALQSGRVDSSVGEYQTGLTPLQPTTEGRTLDVTATGEAGIDWSNIGTPTATVNLSDTTIKTVSDQATPNSDIAAIKAKTDNLPSNPAATSDIPTANENADALIARNITGGSSTGRLVKDVLAASRNKVAFDVPAVGQFTVYDIDDTTALWVGTYARGANTLGPLTGVDPT